MLHTDQKESQKTAWMSWHLTGTMLASLLRKMLGHGPEATKQLPKVTT